MSDPLVFFNPIFPGWLIALLVIPFFSFLLWKEIKRKQKFLQLRIIAQLLVLISILGLLLKPGYRKEIRSAGLIMLTPGYQKEKIDSLLEIRPDLGIIHFAETESYKNSRLLTSYQDLAKLDNEILFVVGEGIPSYALDLMDVKKFQFIGSPKPTGIIELHLPEVSSINQLSKVGGVFNATDKTTLVLLGPGGREDSVNITKKGLSPFSLAFKPKQAGSYLYSLQYRDGTEIQSEQVPIVVTEEQKLSILVLQKFPSFEIRQLKNFLAENGHRLALRYQVSKNNYRVEFANVSAIRTSPLTKSALQAFDLAIVDRDGLESLSVSERNTLEESIRQGLGLIILSNKPAEDDKLRARFLPMDFKRTLKDTAYINLSKPYTLPILPLEVVDNSSVYPITKKGARIFSAYCYNGFGKTGVQLLQETYRIALEGNVDDYAVIWSSLIEKTARRKNESVKIQLNTPFPFYEDEPLAVAFIAAKEISNARHDLVPLSLIEHVTIDQVWLGKTWAGNPGWHRLSADSAVLPYFVSGPSEWKTLRICNQLKQNELESVNKSTSSQPDIFYQRIPVSSIVFYMLFLIAAGFLWLAPKI